MTQWLQLAAAITILIPFTLTQFRLLDQHSYLYLLLNGISSAVLATLAAQGHQWGFLLLEGVWSLVSFWGVFARLQAARIAPKARQ